MYSRGAELMGDANSFCFAYGCFKVSLGHGSCSKYGEGLCFSCMMLQLNWELYTRL